MYNDKKLCVFYKKLDDTYDDIINLGEISTKIYRWIYDNLYRFYLIKGENKKAQFILNFYENQLERRKQEKESHFLDRLQEIYQYYMKTNIIPIHDKDAYFSDGVSMKGWLNRHLFELEKLSKCNQIAKLIIDSNKVTEEVKNLNLNSRIDELYAYFNSKTSGNQIDVKDSFSDNINIINWLDKNISRLYELSNADLKMIIVINFYINTKRKKNILDKDTIKKLSELYLYVLKNELLPKCDSEEKFSDGSNIRKWFDSNLDILNSVKCNNLYANAILAVYRIENKKNNFFKINLSKIDEVYNICKNKPIYYIFKNNIKFEDGTDMSSWIKTNIGLLEELKEKNKKARKILDSINEYNILNKKLEQIECLKKSLEFNKKILGIYNYCVSKKSLPTRYSDCKLNNGYSMGCWLNNNKFKIWDERFRNPYCLKLIKEILEINPEFFTKTNSCDNTKTTYNKISTKRIKLLINSRKL